MWVLGDQLSPRISSLEGFGPGECVVFMAESRERARLLPYHKQKLALLWSAMRHFANELRGMGYTVDYRVTGGDFGKALAEHVEEYGPGRIRLMDTAEYGVAGRLARAVEELGVECEVTTQSMFLSGREEFARRSEGKKLLVMESFYRRMRRETGLLMDGGEPEGGSWNYDKENREPPPGRESLPGIPAYEPDRITAEVMELVEREFPENFGSLEGFGWPVTRKQAGEFLEDFLENRLDLFGPYEDAMLTGEPALYHSQLSPLLNLGLLEPLDVCERAEERYRRGEARLNSVEGFIRQILGWREFVYQIHHLEMPGYTEENHLGAKIPLPEFYWSGETRMHCVSDAVSSLIENGVNHHIQRLMVTGNFALIAGLDPQEVNEWYWYAYADGYEWVTTPNVIGMTLYADGGVFATKPYAASANYIDKMSDYCKHCSYNPRKTTGEDACPFNALYWDFLDRNAESFENNPRMNLAMSNLKKKKDLKEIRAKAKDIRDSLREQPGVVETYYPGGSASGR